MKGINRIKSLPSQSPPSSGRKRTYLPTCGHIDDGWINQLGEELGRKQIRQALLYMDVQEKSEWGARSQPCEDHREELSR